MVANNTGMMSAFIKKTVFNCNNPNVFRKAIMVPSGASTGGVNGTTGMKVGTWIIDSSSGGVYLACAATGSGVITYQPVWVGTGSV
jgi:hypothetical protein